MAQPEPIRALIVDDDPVVARSIARRLLREGYTVSLAQTCRAARASGAGFQVAILDLDLPDGSGVDLADELLRLGAIRGVVFYSGSLDTAQRSRAVLFGTLVDKSHDVEEVIQALELFPTAPPISELSPAPRQRSRPSGSRLTRVTADEAARVETAGGARSSRR